MSEATRDLGTECAAWLTRYRIAYWRDHKDPDDTNPMPWDDRWGPNPFIDHAQTHNFPFYKEIVYRNLAQVMQDLEVPEPRNQDLHDAIAKARGEGYEAGRANQTEHMNPHVDGSDQFYSWYMGWETGQGDYNFRNGVRV